MSLRRTAAIALASLIALIPALVAVDSAAAAYPAPFTGVSYGPKTYVDAQLGAMEVGTYYSDSIQRLVGGTEWELRGTLPAGLSGSVVGDTYVISGTPTTAGDVNFTIASEMSTDFDQIVFDVTVVGTPSAALRPVIDVGPGSLFPAYVSGETFDVWFEYVNDSATTDAISPRLEIVMPTGVINLGGSEQGPLDCTGTQTVVCTTSMPVVAGDSGVPYIATLQIDPAYSKSTVNLTSSASATNSAFQTASTTVQVFLFATGIETPNGPAPWSNVTLVGYAPDGRTAGDMQFVLTDGTITRDYWASVQADGSATFSGAIDSAFSGNYVTASANYHDGLNSPVPSAADPGLTTFYVYQQHNVGGTFYLNGAVYTGAVKVFIYAEVGYSGVFNQYSFSGGTYNVTPSGYDNHRFYMWAQLTDRGNATTYYNTGGLYTTDVNQHSTVGYYNFTDSMNFYWESAPEFTDSTIAVPRQNVAYSDGVSASNNVALTYSIESGALPTGLNLNSSTGAITGTATVVGEDYSVVIRAENSTNSQHATTSTISGTVLPEHIAPSWSDNVLAPFRVDQTVTDGVTADGDPTIEYELSSGSLPDGVTLDAATGQLSGAPTTFGEDYSFQLRAYNDWGDVYESYSGAVLSALAAPVWTDMTLGELRIGETLNDGVAAVGVPTPIYSITAGALPGWLSLNGATGAITGTPTTMIPYDFTVRASNSEGYVEVRFAGDVEPAWVAPFWDDDTIAPLQAGVATSDGVLADGDGSMTYSVPLGSLPTGLSLDPATGAITGTIPESETATPYSFTITATSVHGHVDVTASGVIAAAPSTGLTLNFAVGDTAAGASFDYEVSGGGATAAYSVTVNSTPVVVASGFLTAGAATGTATIPSSITAGAHSIVLLTSASDGTARTTTVWFTVLANGTIGAISLTGPLSVTGAALAATGTDAGSPLLLAFAMLTAGAIIVARRRAARA